MRWILRLGKSFQVKRMVILCAALLLTTGVAAGQDEGHHWTANIGAGYTPLVGDMHDDLNDGWNLTFGGGYRFNSFFSFEGEAMYDGLGVPTKLLDRFSVPAGNAHVWVVTAEPRVDFAPHRRFSPYILLGFGYYRRTVNFTQPTVAAVDVFDPFFFGFFPVLVPANEILGTIVRDGIGGNGGFGFDMRVGHGAKVFLQARYDYGATGNVPIRMVPITLGIRF
jgi:Outer membrane protein beta-barrel domain